VGEDEIYGLMIFRQDVDSRKAPNNNTKGATVGAKVKSIHGRAAQGFKFDLHSLEVRGPTPDLPGAFQIAKTTRLDALIVVANPLMNQYAKQVFELATKNRLPSITEERRYVNAGGLVSYGPNRDDLYRRAAEYVVEILKGAKPSDLPIKLPSKFEIFINLKTAREIGVVIPQHVLIQADTVIK
jgi:putative ABC transport system substrate-binding protein